MHANEKEGQPFSVFCLRSNIFKTLPLLVSDIELHGKPKLADWHIVMRPNFRQRLSLGVRILMKSGKQILHNESGKEELLHNWKHGSANGFLKDLLNM